MNDVIYPFLKWAGGKRQLLPYIRKSLPSKFNKYYEPFIGGGAVLFDLKHKNAVINDINKALINTYKSIKQYPLEVIAELETLDHAQVDDSKLYYYKQRNVFNDKLSKNEYDIKLAALFIYLNKHCYNGLYRVNSKGLFNVPFNNKHNVSYNKDNILAVSAYLQSITILEGDFEQACQSAQAGDFLFLDSPYAPLNDTSFMAYTKEGFDMESHKRLANMFNYLTKKGCFCMLTNHNTKFIEQLYNKYPRQVVVVRRYINSDAKNRKGEEVIITNYDVK